MNIFESALIVDVDKMHNNQEILRLIKDKYPSIEKLFYFDTSHHVHFIGTASAQNDIDLAINDVYAAVGESFRFSEEDKTLFLKLVEEITPDKMESFLRDHCKLFGPNERFARDDIARRDWGPIYGVCAPTAKRRAALLVACVTVINKQFRIDLTQLSTDVPLPEHVVGCQLRDDGEDSGSIRLMLRELSSTLTPSSRNPVDAHVDHAPIPQGDVPIAQPHAHDLHVHQPLQAEFSTSVHKASALDANRRIGRVLAAYRWQTNNATHPHPVPTDPSHAGTTIVLPSAGTTVLRGQANRFRSDDTVPRTETVHNSTYVDEWGRFHTYPAATVVHNLPSADPDGHSRPFAGTEATHSSDQVVGLVVPSSHSSTGKADAAGSAT
ncbi:Hypothetical protein, putative [Bodo saltans]|uniref:Uncharacterized protein n=1 Tax=Bodo saltans TaxID=75058 RepID=A0A0S4IH64_BODSA|nr:Hypothetical protein, putative [Bodo saltans]|eukprot:CUE59111.1 Hypothetical protein, putative [Bodo saltans]